MNEILEVRGSDQPLETIQLRRIEADDEDDHGATIELLAAADALAEGWITPLAAGLLAECCDPDSCYENVGYPDRGSWFGRTADLDPSLWVSQGYADAVEYLPRPPERAPLEAMLQAALAEPCSEGVTCFAEMTWTVVRVRLPVPEVAVTFGHTHAPVRQERRDDGATWATGPLTDGPLGPPLRVRLTNQHGTTKLELDVFWDLWLTHPAGRAQVQHAIDRVLARDRGWTMAPRDS